MRKLAIILSILILFYQVILPVTFAKEKDTEGPVFQKLILHKKTIRQGQAPWIDIKAIDEGSEILGGTIEYNSPDKQEAPLKGELYTYEKTTLGCFIDSVPDSGATGVWNLSKITLTDKAGNTTTIVDNDLQTPSNPQDIKMDLSFGDFKVKLGPKINVTLNSTLAHLKVGEEMQLVTTIEPQNAEPEQLQFISSNPSIITVNEKTGKVKANGPGKAEVNVMIDDYFCMATCKFIVENTSDYYQSALKQLNVKLKSALPGQTVIFAIPKRADIILRSPSGRSQKTIQLIIDDPKSDYYIGKWVVQPFDENGVWKVEKVAFRDKQGVTYYNKELYPKAKNIFDLKKLDVTVSKTAYDQTKKLSLSKMKLNNSTVLLGKPIEGTIELNQKDFVVETGNIIYRTQHNETVYGMILNNPVTKKGFIYIDAPITNDTYRMLKEESLKVDTIRIRAYNPYIDAYIDREFKNKDFYPSEYNSIDMKALNVKIKPRKDTQPPVIAEVKLSKTHAYIGQRITLQAKVTDDSNMPRGYFEDSMAPGVWYFIRSSNQEGQGQQNFFARKNGKYLAEINTKWLKPGKYTITSIEAEDVFRNNTSYSPNSKNRLEFTVAAPPKNSNVDLEGPQLVKLTVSSNKVVQGSKVKLIAQATDKRSKVTEVNLVYSHVGETGNIQSHKVIMTKNKKGEFEGILYIGPYSYIGGWLLSSIELKDSEGNITYGASKNLSNVNVQVVLNPKK